MLLKLPSRIYLSVKEMKRVIQDLIHECTSAFRGHFKKRTGIVCLVVAEKETLELFRKAGYLGGSSRDEFAIVVSLSLTGDLY